MSRLLPFKSETTRKPDGAKVLSLEDEATEEALSALSSDTAREILSLVYEEPRTPPEIRDEIDSSLQNVHYHLEKLEDAGLIQPAGSGYSEKGTEMTVFAPASEAVVLFAGRERDRSRLKTALTRLLGAVGLLAVASAVVRRVAETSDVASTALSSGGDDGGAPEAADDATGTPTADATETPTAAAADAPADGSTGTPTESEDAGGLGIQEVTDTPADDSGAPTATETAPGESTPTQPPDGTPDLTATPTGEPTATSTAQPTGTPTETPLATETPVGTPADEATQAATEAQVEEAETATATPVPDGGSTPVDTTVADEAVRAASDGGLLADPAVTFFLGGVFMLVVVAGWWYLSG